MQLFVKQREAVEDVDGQPADGEQSHDDGEGFGGPDLLLQQPVVMVVPVAHALELDLSQLLPGHGEDLQVDAQHDEQRRQHADKEIKVDHVVHVHHTLKQTRELAAPYQAPETARGVCRVCSVVRCSAIALAVFVLQVPAKERDEANDEGEDP